MKRTKKTLSLILALAMVLTLFAGVAQAEPLEARHVTISADDPLVVAGDGRQPGTIIIRRARNSVVEGNFFTEVSVRLPLNVTWGGVAEGTHISALDATGTTATTSLIFSRLEEGGRNLTFVVTSTVNIAELRLSGRSLNVASGFSGAVNAEINIFSRAPGGVLNWRETMTVRVAEVPAAGTTTTVRDATRILSGASHQDAGTIEISENAVGALTEGSLIRLTLPDGVAFSGVPTVGGAALSGGLYDGNRRINIRVLPNQRIGGLYRRRIITISNIDLNVRREVADGPINVVIDNLPVANNDSKVTRAEVTVATVGVMLVNVSRQGDLPATWNLGTLENDIGTIRLAETVAGALSPRRMVTLTLPVGYTWHTAPSEDGAFSDGPTVADGGRTLIYWTLLNFTTSRTDFDLEGGKINAHIDAVPGDVVVTVGGNAGATGTAVVATSRRPVTVTAATVPNIRADSANQVVGNIVITESVTGTFKNGTMRVWVPIGVSVTGASVSVSDVVGSEPTAFVQQAIGNVVDIRVTEAIAPINPATIIISGIRISAELLPLVTVGPLSVDIEGLIIEEGDAGELLEDINMYDEDATGRFFATDLVVANMVVRTARTTVFTVGSTDFTVDGAARSFVSPARALPAPFIQDGRTLVPIRAAANAVGITDDNIIWDPATRTVTLIRDDRIAQFTVGSRVAIANGMPIPMLAPMANVGGFTMIPAGYVARIFGGTATWDGAARTVTVAVR